MDREEAQELVDDFVIDYEDRHGNPPEELRVSRAILVALGAAPDERELAYGAVRLFLDLGLDSDVVELA